MSLRQPIVVVLGHVDHGKTTLLDKIRGTAIAAREAGAISQHIGASFVPADTLKNVCRSLLLKFKFQVEIPGLLFIDTPGHAAFSNLRRRGGSIADIAVLVIDLMQGVQPQTLESLEILKAKKTPLVVAANKLDTLSGWRSQGNRSFLDALTDQDSSLIKRLDERVYTIVGILSYHGLTSDRYDRIADFTKNLAIVPLSAKTGEGIPDLLTVLTGLTQQFMKDQLTLKPGPAKATVLEVLEEVGLGFNVNAIIYEGVMHDDDWIVVGGREKAHVTKVRALLVPRPLDEIRDPREKFKHMKEVTAVAGVKIVAPNLEEAVPGAPIYAARNVKAARELIGAVTEDIESVKISTNKLGIIIKAEALGSLEAIVIELQNRNISVRNADIGDISRRDVVEASAVKRENSILGVILGFNARLLPDAEEEAKRGGIMVFRENVIYQLIETYDTWAKKEIEAKAQKALEILTRPGKIRILPGMVFRRSNPAIFGVEVMGGRVKSQYSLLRENAAVVGEIQQIQDKNETLPEAIAPIQVAISMKDLVVGRHIKEGEILFVVVPEDHVKQLMQHYSSELSQDEIQILREYVAIMRKKQDYFAVGFGLDV